MTPLTGLVRSWRERAALLRPYAPFVARAFEDASTELERELETVADELLALRAAAEYSGYSADHLRRLVREGKLRNAGRPHAPRFRRADLPLKPAQPAQFDGPADRGYDPLADARQVAARRAHGGEP
jgi:hypothetical protein